MLNALIHNFIIILLLFDQQHLNHNSPFSSSFRFLFKFQAHTFLFKDCNRFIVQFVNVCVCVVFLPFFLSSSSRLFFSPCLSTLIIPVSRVCSITIAIDYRFLAPKSAEVGSIQLADRFRSFSPLNGSALQCHPISWPFNHTFDRSSIGRIIVMPAAHSSS